MNDNNDNRKEKNVVNIEDGFENYRLRSIDNNNKLNDPSFLFTASANYVMCGKLHAIHSHTHTHAPR